MLTSPIDSLSLCSSKSSFSFAGRLRDEVVLGSRAGGGGIWSKKSTA